MIMWGVLVFAGNLLVLCSCRATAPMIWLAINVLADRAARSRSARWLSRDRRAQPSTLRLLAAFLLFLGFGYVCTLGSAISRARQMDTFWPIYFMLFYTIAGLWFGSPLSRSASASPR